MFALGATKASIIGADRTLAIEAAGVTVERAAMTEMEPRAQPDTTETQPSLQSATVQMTPQQKAFHSALIGRDGVLGDIYLGAATILVSDQMPDRWALAAHGLRELMDRISRHVDVPMPAHRDSMGNHVNNLRPRWTELCRQSSCCAGGSWDGLIDSHLRGFLGCLDEFFAWLDGNRVQRREEAARLLRALEPSRRPLPVPLERLNTESWQVLAGYFNRAAHHGSVEPKEFLAYVDALERFLLDRLRPRTFEDFAAIDAILEELGDA